MTHESGTAVTGWFCVPFSLQLQDEILMPEWLEPLVYGFVGGLSGGVVAARLARRRFRSRFQDGPE